MESKTEQTDVTSSDRMDADQYEMVRKAWLAAWSSTLYDFLSGQQTLAKRTH